MKIVSIPIAHNYLDPLLIMPILFQTVTWEHQYIRGEKDFYLPWSYLLGYFLLVSILAEVVFPTINRQLIGDPWDVVCYAVGTVGFAVMQKKRNF
ncbi:hypothetical protein FAZ15_07545 [Sphingobacterium olei]|uniref:Magnesium citrate secondary transporter n=1 Tax=Sphingobacterium olei TaxID=2571155 RepID=A0A4U0P1D2_9SPHI|nr:hypothetical protein [Sphingobacterium olei]TJZ61057.1 hypothetical protein FAZ15_07545 [Sphingobacterium olei]